MKGWTVVGWADTEQGCVYCPDCARDRFGEDVANQEIEGLHPIFAIDDDWDDDVCDKCLQKLTDLL